MGVATVRGQAKRNRVGNTIYQQYEGIQNLIAKCKTKDIVLYTKNQTKRTSLPVAEADFHFKTTCLRVNR